MTEILTKDISSIRSITAKANTSAETFEKLIYYLESEAQRIGARDIKSVAKDIVAIELLSNESKKNLEELELYANDGDVLEIFKIGEKIKNALLKIKSL